ncbi:MAG: BLUF domain-containing protein [Pseudomonadota bacterium]
MTKSAEHRPHPDRVFRLSYASRATLPLDHAETLHLAESAALSNARDDISGVLFADHGMFLQWLEGPAPKVCELMSRIVADTRHTDVTVLNAGWMPNRRYASWSMRLANVPLPRAVESKTSDAEFAALYSNSSAVDAFEAVAATYQRQRISAQSMVSLADFADQLIHRSSDLSPAMPRAAVSGLRARAQFVDDVCLELQRGWEEDRWNSVEVAIAMAHLYLLWQRAGRVRQPSSARRSVAVVVPPDSTEILGAIVKTDLLRSAGSAVRLIRAPTINATIEVLTWVRPDEVVIAGSRTGSLENQRRAEHLAEAMRGRFADTPVFVGGSDTGQLGGWADRMACKNDDTDAMPAITVDWHALSQVAQFAEAAR